MTIRVIEADSLQELHEKADKMEQQGWQFRGGFSAAPVAALQGIVPGIAVTGSGFVLRYFLAMVKESN